MKPYAVGLDGGNTRCKAMVRVGNQLKEVTFPSARTQGSLTRLANSRSSRGDNQYRRDYECLDSDEYVVQLDGHPERFYGRLALEEDPRASSGIGDPLRYSNDRTQEMLAIAVGTQIPDEECDIYLVMGVPANVYSARNVESIQNALKKEIRCKLNGRDRYFFVREVRVLREGSGASIVLAPPKDKRKGVGGIIDIGGYSVDLYGYGENLKVVDRLCGGISKGVETIMDEVDVLFCQQYQLDEQQGLTSKQRHDCLMHYSYPLIYNCPTLHIRGQEVPVRELRNWMKIAIESVGATITSSIADRWGTTTSGEIAINFGKVDVIGGGARILQEEISKRIERATFHEKDYLQNALGYAKVAEHMLGEGKKVIV